VQMFEHHQPFAATHLGQVRSTHHPLALPPARSLSHGVLTRRSLARRDRW
jgi:hypothetical protein